MLSLSFSSSHSLSLWTLTWTLSTDVGGTPTAGAGSGRGGGRSPRSLEEREQRTPLPLLRAPRGEPRRAGVRRLPRSLHTRPRAWVRWAVRGSWSIREPRSSARERGRVSARASAPAGALPWAGVRAARVTISPASASPADATSTHDGAPTAASRQVGLLSYVLRFILSVKNHSVRHSPLGPSGFFCTSPFLCTPSHVRFFSSEHHRSADTQNVFLGAVQTSSSLFKPSL